MEQQIVEIDPKIGFLESVNGESVKSELEDIRENALLSILDSEVDLKDIQAKLWNTEQDKVKVRTIILDSRLDFVNSAKKLQEVFNTELVKITNQLNEKYNSEVLKIKQLFRKELVGYGLIELVNAVNEFGWVLVMKQNSVNLYKCYNPCYPVSLGYYEDGRIREYENPVTYLRGIYLNILHPKITTGNRKVAEDIKSEIEREIENMQLSSPSQNYVTEKPLNPEPITLTEAITKYKTRLAMRSKSHQVIFDVVMERLFNFVSKETIVAEINREHVIAFISSYMGNVSNASLITYLNYLKGFFTYLIEEGYISKSPVRKKDLPRRERKRIITFDDGMLEDILDSARNKDVNFYNILMLMWLTGIRPNDVLRLKAGDFDFRNSVINLKIAKTKKEIRFPLYNELKNFIESEMNQVLQMDKEQLIFPDYSVSRLGRKFRRLKVQLSITDKHAYTLKTFRKSFATKMAGFMDIQDVKSMLGHDSVNTSLHFYADVKVDKVRDKINKNINN
jgi:integrase/recombinase XerC